MLELLERVGFGKMPEERTVQDGPRPGLENM